MVLRKVLLLCFISEATLQYILVDSERSSMTTSFTKCREEGGTLITNELLHEYADVIKEQCQTLDTYYWMGNYGTLTPFLFMDGCFAYKNLSTRLYEIDKNSIAKCEARCRNFVGIAIMDNVCQCVDDRTDKLKTLTPVDVSSCNIHRNEELLGGNQSAMSVYIRGQDQSSDRLHPYCCYGQCDGRRYLRCLPCRDSHVANVICRERVGVLTSSWWEAMQECIHRHGSYPLTPQEFQDNITTWCVKTDGSLTWTNERQYTDQLIIPDIGVEESFIFSPTITCKVVNLTELTKLDTPNCNVFGIEAHGYICYVDGETLRNASRQNSQCVVKLELQASGTSTTNRYTIISDLEIKDKKVPNGTIIAIVTSILILIAIVIGVIFAIRILKLRKQRKETHDKIQIYDISQNSRRFQQGTTYEELEKNDGTHNMNNYEKIKGKSAVRADYYGDLQKYENMDANHVYETYDGSNEDTKRDTTHRI